MKIYFDNCCLNRPFDDLFDHIVRMEAEATLSIIDSCESGEWEWFSSDVLLDEILEMSNVDRREKVSTLHLASAEAGDADVLLTTDKRFINAAKKSNTYVSVQNPLIWLTEALYDKES